MALPEVVVESTEDDIQSSDVDLASLKQKYINPIDAIRSLRAAAVLSNSEEASFDQNGRIRVGQRIKSSSPFNPVEQQESRAHAFYRLIGLPVISEDFDFYSPGWGGGILGEKEEERRAQVANRVSSQVRFMQHLREEEARRRIEIFKKQSTYDSMYCISIGAPNGKRQFQVLNDFKTFFDFDGQVFAQEERKKFVVQNYKTNTEDESVGELWPAFDLITGTHKLRPFMVDPNIENAADGGTKKICVPFLPDKETTRWEGSKFLKRPGIELVLRLRLKQQNELQRIKEGAHFLQAQIPAQILLATAENNAALDNAGITWNDLRSIINAAAGEIGAVDDEEVKNLLLSSTAFELIQLTQFVRLIKALLRRLANAFETIAEVSKKISWVPFAGEQGPEFGANLNFTYLSCNNIFPLERQIRAVKLRRANAQRQNPVSDNDDVTINDFVINSFENTEIDYGSALSELEEQRNELIRRGADALQEIELITGDVSGFGLIDILAVYTALWAIDLEVLVNLIDDSAFKRLWDFNKDLRLGPATSRNAGTTIPIEEAMDRFESQILNILAFADKIFEQERAVPDEAEGGSIPRE